MMRPLLTLFCVCCWLMATVAPLAAADAETDYQRAKASYRKLQETPKLQRYRDQWQAVIQRLDMVSSRYPTHPRATDASYLVAEAYRGLYKVSRLKADARRAVIAYDDLASAHPDSNLADDALLAAGELLAAPLREFEQAYQRYARLAERYPGGDQAATARDRLNALAAHAPRNTPPPTVPTAKPASPAELSAIRFWSNPGYTRIVLSLSGKSSFSRLLLKADPVTGSGPRLCIDLENVVLAAGLTTTQAVGDGLLRQIRAGRQEGSRVRVVLDLLSFKKYEIFPLEDPYRVVIDIAGETSPPQVAIPSPVEVLPPAKTAATPDQIGQLVASTPIEPTVQLSLPTASNEAGLRKIVVDAGHGGKDPGAIGFSGRYEKDVTLALAKVLGARLQKELGCQVIYTRTDDTYLPLEERTAIANEAGADLFISLHANANNNSDIHGVETYYLNFSKNEQAAAVAARENGTSLKQVGDLEQILFDLMAHSKINESSRLAGEIQKALVADLGRNFKQIKDLGVRQGPFYVLLGATMPSVLVESAFISNKREESRLTDRRFQEQTADAILRGVRNYATSLKLIAER